MGVAAWDSSRNDCRRFKFCNYNPHCQRSENQGKNCNFSVIRVRDNRCIMHRFGNSGNWVNRCYIRRRAGHCNWRFHTRHFICFFNRSGYRNCLRNRVALCFKSYNKNTLCSPAGYCNNSGALRNCWISWRKRSHQRVMFWSRSWKRACDSRDNEDKRENGN